MPDNIYIEKLIKFESFFILFFFKQYIVENRKQNLAIDRHEVSFSREDFFLWLSTTNNQQAIRFYDDGSPFIKFLVKHICENAWKDDILRIFTKVNFSLKTHTRGIHKVSTLNTLATKLLCLKVKFD